MTEQIAPDQQAKWRDAFSKFDRNGDGTVVVAELSAVMESLHMVPAAGEVDAMIAAADRDCNGSIDFAEFCQMMVQAGRNGTKVGFSEVVARVVNMSEVMKLIG